MEMEAAALGLDLAEGPGFLIRRLHRIHVALFAEECAGFDVTPVQYGILCVIAERPGMDQARIGEEVGLDRMLLPGLVGRLEQAGLLYRITSRLDRRQKLLSLTPKGKALMMRMQEPVARAHARTIGALEPEAQAVFMRLLKALVQAGDAFAPEDLRLM